METEKYNISRFIQAQDTNGCYETALAELRNGKKRTHWIWYIMPQLRGLGHSYNSRYYGISCLDEARAYLSNPILNERLHETIRAFLSCADKDLTPRKVLGAIDAAKVRSCCTLFDLISPNDVFAQCLDTFYEGERDENTLKRIENAKF